MFARAVTRTTRDLESGRAELAARVVKGLQAETLAARVEELAALEGKLNVLTWAETVVHQAADAMHGMNEAQQMNWLKGELLTVVDMDRLVARGAVRTLRNLEAFTD